MFGAIFHGILVGLLLAVMIGPVFLALMSVTISQGKKKAYFFMAGNAISDWLFAFLTYNGLVLWHNNTSNIGRIIGVVGACIFAFYGVYLLRKKDTPEDIKIDTSKKTRSIKNIGIVIKGFIMNTVNPSLFIFWITVISQFIHRSHHPDKYTVRTYLICILVTFVITDIIKINSAHWILKKLTIKNLDTLHHVAGVLLIIAGTIMLIRTVR